MRKWLAVALLLSFCSLAAPSRAATPDNRVWSPSGSVYRSGGRATLAARTFVAGTNVAFTLFSRQPVELGHAIADRAGVAHLTVRLPHRLAHGLYAIRASGLGKFGAQNVDLDIRIKASHRPPWAVTRDQVTRYLLTVAALTAFGLFAIQLRRRRRLSATAPARLSPSESRTHG